MPNYVHKDCTYFKKNLRGGKEYSPHICAPIQYGHKSNMHTLWMHQSNSQIKEPTSLNQKVCGNFLYYAIAIDNTIIPALSEVSSEQSKATNNTAKQVAKLLKYIASNPNTEIQYRYSGMQLAIHSDTSYLSVSQARIRASGVHFLSEGPQNPKNLEDFVPTVNGIILVVCKIMRNIMASAAEAKYGTIFVNS